MSKAGALGLDVTSRPDGVPEWVRVLWMGAVETLISSMV